MTWVVAEPYAQVTVAAGSTNIPELVLPLLFVSWFRLMLKFVTGTLNHIFAVFAPGVRLRYPLIARVSAGLLVFVICTWMGRLLPALPCHVAPSAVRVTPGVEITCEANPFVGL